MDIILKHIQSGNLEKILDKINIKKPLHNNNYLIHYIGYNNDLDLFNKII